MPLRYASPCVICGAQYLDGSSTTCVQCRQLTKNKKKRVRTGIRFRCDCGQMAVTVILVTVGEKDSRYTVRLPLCPACLEIEKETQGQLDLLNPPSARLIA